jgi:predicted RNA-binding protein with PIN domain
MPYIIDGHNLIPKIPGISLQTMDDEKQLIHILQIFCRQKRKKVEVYFDNAPVGGQKTRRFGQVTAHFIRQGSTADAAIRTHLRKLGRSAHNWTVVTSDREIIVSAREAHARVISSEDFAKLITKNNIPNSISPETDENLSLNADAVDEWLQLFGNEEIGS